MNALYWISSLLAEGLFACLLCAMFRTEGALIIDKLGWIKLAVPMTVLLLGRLAGGKGLHRVVEERLTRWMLAIEGAFFKLAGFNADEGMHWKRYAVALSTFNFIGVLAVYACAQHAQSSRAHGQAAPEARSRTGPAGKTEDRDSGRLPRSFLIRA